MADLTLIGYRYSVYTRVARMALSEKRLTARYVEANPFDVPLDANLQAVSPFGRVPLLRDGDFELFETVALTRYVDDLGPEPCLSPTGARAQARMVQIISIIDSYGYSALVRKVFSHGMFRPHFGEPSDPDMIAAGLAASQPVLRALEGIAAEGLQLAPDTISRADLHLAPMLAYFVMVPEGRAMLDRHPALSRWFDKIRERESFVDTEPGLPVS